MCFAGEPTEARASAASDSDAEEDNASHLAHAPTTASPKQIHGGWGYKQGRLSSNSWNKRWIVVEPWQLSTYASTQPGATPTKVLDLQDAQFVKEVRLSLRVFVARLCM